MNRKHIRRAVALAASTALVILSIGTASAANTRVLYVGAPGGSSDGTITPLPVSPGNTTYVDVFIKNNGKQTLSGLSFGIGTKIATSGLDANGSVITGHGLPTGWAVTGVTMLAGSGTCTPGGDVTGGYDGYSCSLGNLAKGASRTLRVGLFAGPTLDTSIQVSGQVAENTGGNVGSNNNTFFADTTNSSGFFVSGAGFVAGLFKNKNVTPDVHGAVQTSIDLTGITTDTPVYINENVIFDCPSTMTCLDGASRASVAQGGVVTPYFVWTMLFPVSSSFQLKTSVGIVHFFDNYDPTTNPNAYETLYNVNKTSCSKGKLPCADFSLVTQGTDTFLQVIFESQRNGTVKTRL